MEYKTIVIKQVLLYFLFIAAFTEGLAQTTDTAKSKLRDTSVLKQVTITARRALIKPTIDGFVYNADADAAIGAGNAVDVLRRIPSITISMEGSPRVQGSNNIKVFIDNKPSEIYASSLADALRQIPAASIASVEVITQPSARYDAEGTDAVINIITKKSRYDGTAGRIETNLGNRNQHTGASIKWRKNKIILSLEANYYRYNNWRRTFLERVTTGGSALNQQTDYSSVWNTWVTRGGFTWMIDTLNTFSAGYQYRQVNEESSSGLQSVYESTWYNRDIEQYYGNRLNVFNSTYTSSSRNRKRELSFVGFYFFNNERNSYDLEQHAHDGKAYRERNNARTGNRELSAQVDYVQSFTGNMKLETGVKTVWRWSRSTNLNEPYDVLKGDYFVDPIRSNRFDYDRSIYAAYLTYLINIKKWSIRIGGRYEQTKLYALFKDTVLRLPEFNNWIPNILISRSLPDNQMLKFSYSNKVIRPYLSSLNPTVNYVDSFNIEYGNPDLQPIIIHGWQFGYQFTKGLFTGGAMLAFDLRDRNIEPVKFVSEGVAATTYRNVGSSLIYGSSLNLSYNDNKRVNASAATTLQYIKLKSAALQLTNSGLIMYYSARFSYRFDKGWQAETSVHYDPPNVRIQGSGPGWFFYSLIVNKKWAKDKLITSFSMENFLTKYQYRYEVFRTEDFYQKTTTRLPVQFLKLGVSYRFGKTEIKDPSRRAEVGE